MTDDRIAAIRERCETALSFAKDCDRTNNGCQVPQVLKLLEHDIPYLLTELATMTARAEKAEKEVERLKGAVNEIENDNDKAEFYISSLTEEVERLRAAQRCKTQYPVCPSCAFFSNGLYSKACTDCVEHECGCYRFNDTLPEPPAEKG